MLVPVAEAFLPPGIPLPLRDIKRVDCCSSGNKNPPFSDAVCPLPSAHPPVPLPHARASGLARTCAFTLRHTSPSAASGRCASPCLPRANGLPVPSPRTVRPFLARASRRAYRTVVTCTAHPCAVLFQDAHATVGHNVLTPPQLALYPQRNPRRFAPANSLVVRPSTLNGGIKNVLPTLRAPAPAWC